MEERDGEQRRRSVSMEGAQKKKKKKKGGGEAGSEVKPSAASWPAFITASPPAGCVRHQHNIAFIFVKTRNGNAAPRPKPRHTANS